MPSCVVKWCVNNSTRDNKTTGISFHLFPQKSPRREYWTDAVRWERQEPSWKPSNCSVVCSIHFKNEDFYASKKNFRMLKKTAVPICTMVEKDKTNIPPLIRKENIQRKIKVEPCTNPKENHFLKKELRNNNISRREIKVEPCSSPRGNDFLKEEVIDENISRVLTSEIATCEHPMREIKVEPCTSPEGNHCLKEEVIDDNISKVPSSEIATCERPMVTCPKCGCNFGAAVVNNEGSNAVPIVLHNANDRNKSSHFIDPNTHKLKEKLKKKSILAERRLSKIKSLKRSLKRLLKKHISLKGITNDLKKQSVLLKANIQSLSGVSKDIFNSIQCRRNKKLVEFTPAIKKFALTLNRVSPTGYKYVRKQFDSCLPHPATLAKWYKTVNGDPGFTGALETEFEHSDKNLGGLIVDEMAEADIKQEKTFDSENVEGFVSAGNSDEMATEAYVME